MAQTCVLVGTLLSLTRAVQLTAKSRGALPEVSTLFGGAADTLKSINSQTIMLETRVAQKQQENQAQLTKLKTSYETKLKTQHSENVAASAALDKDLAAITRLEKQNDGIRADSDVLMKENAVFRTTIGSMGAKLGTALAFVDNSLNVTDANKEDAEVDYLSDMTKVEREKTEAEERKRTGADPAMGLASSDSVEHAMETIVRTGQLEEGLATSRGFSLLEVSSQHKKAGGAADSLITTLSKSLEAMDIEEKENEQRLKELFITRYQAGVKQQFSLASRQKVATEKLQSLGALQARLKIGKAKLEDTHKQLEQRLAGLRLFVGRLSSNITTR